MNLGEEVVMMSVHKYKLLKVEKTWDEKLREWAWDHAPLLIWATIGIFVLLALAYFQTVSRAEFLLQYGSVG